MALDWSVTADKLIDYHLISKSLWSISSLLYAEFTVYIFSRNNYGVAMSRFSPLFHAITNSNQAGNYLLILAKVFGVS